jgi:hypothetical protein
VVLLRLGFFGPKMPNRHRVVDFKWEVTYNSKHGQAGPLAYKVDTLVINRLLDQIGRPLPELIRIGSLSDVCRSLGTQDTGPNIANLKSAFLQNASAFINAKIRYKSRTVREKWAEMGYTRYSVVFTGEAAGWQARRGGLYSSQPTLP